MIFADIVGFKLQHLEVIQPLLWALNIDDNDTTFYFLPTNSYLKNKKVKKSEKPDDRDSIVELKIKKIDCRIWAWWKKENLSNNYLPLMEEFYYCPHTLSCSKQEQILMQKRALITEITCRASRFETAIAPTYGRLSITASAKSEIKVGSQPSAGTLPHFCMPDFRASSLYSTSISSNVSICSLTKLW